MSLVLRIVMKKRKKEMERKGGKRSLKKSWFGVWIIKIYFIVDFCKFEFILYTLIMNTRTGLNLNLTINFIIK